MPIGAALGGGLAQAGATWYAANQAGNASKQEQANLAPWMTAGKNAINTLSNPNALMANFYTSPGYQFRLGQGLNAVGTDKAVNGLLRSGGAIKSLNNYAQGQASNEWGNYVNQQEYLATAGQNAATGTNTAIATNATNQGNAALAGANSFDTLLGGLFSKYNQPKNDGSQSSYTKAG